ncbi:MAG: tRNA 4-thiouridine(8) synthase ThiI [Candidatus Marsarchaeota archaeon]|nr:tRNA 4-thiouridine(8) synthase ThiI [Candidatus Marsarchaeota archaeon]
MEFKEGESLIVVHFGELWLKGRNRNDYIRLLEGNIREQLSDESFMLERRFDRLVVRPDSAKDSATIASKLKKVFGISTIELSVVSAPELKKIAAAAKDLLSREPRPKSVRINSHRAYKQLPFKSTDVVEEVRKAAEKAGVEPMIRDYERELNISVTKDAAFLTLNKERGAGGLPVGSSGRAIVLISGGIDSPVAAWYAMKRGLAPVYLHVHAFRENSEAENGKMAEILGVLSGFCPASRAYFVPSYAFQANSTRFGKYELVLLKAFMLRLAEKLAKKEGAGVIVTGESLGQVASQTSSNLMAEQQGIKLPILRPLIGLDKEEIVQLAKRIGTFEPSIKPYKDVCSINAKNPKTKSKAADVKQMLKKMGVGRIVARSIAASSVSG